MEEKCHHEKLKQQIIKCLNCFPNSKIVQPSSTSSAKAFGSLFCAGTRHLYLVSSPGAGYCVPPKHLCCILLQTHSINMHEIYGSICELKCESGFDWSTFPLTAIIFDWLWPKGCIVNTKFSLPDHRAVVHLKKKRLQMPGAAQRCVTERLAEWVKIF